jgi:hypothetical protein
MKHVQAKQIQEKKYRFAFLSTGDSKIAAPASAMLLLGFIMTGSAAHQMIRRRNDRPPSAYCPTNLSLRSMEPTTPRKEKIRDMHRAAKTHFSLEEFLPYAESDT